MSGATVASGFADPRMDAVRHLLRALADSSKYGDPMQIALALPRLARAFPELASEIEEAGKAAVNAAPIIGKADDRRHKWRATPAT